MTSPDSGIEAQIRNIEATYGKPLREWFTVIHASGLTKHTEIIAMLKQRHGMKHGAAHRVALLTRQTQSPQSPDQHLAELYAGRKAQLRPTGDPPRVEEIIAVIRAAGDDAEGELVRSQAGGAGRWRRSCTAMSHTARAVPLRLKALTPSRAHGSQVCQVEVGTPAQLKREGAVGQTSVPRPSTIKR